MSLKDYRKKLLDKIEKLKQRISDAKLTVKLREGIEASLLNNRIADMSIELNRLNADYEYAKNFRYKN